MLLRQRSSDRFLEKNADSIYRMAKDYFNLDNSPSSTSSISTIQTGK
ncbi:hypothetical protein BIFDEN_01432 [Bifidobacterium dentium ATCC 27678]|uniref:Uncharacterized protein n=1 Tax=Bifidobacterium dentium (strain ATCC 27534 / DSM 20436 / JCM 1195 / Bd1) TaxID=401473 RepID=D2Q5V1_BIFDB|nr:Hypothetical protein BDP_1725 [Bifidobacterium dentium Bd1]EDT45598.1 hypothetical protein BIFDEN_01432 [Bifidobacterium dentium ATCC 27678]